MSRALVLLVCALAGLALAGNLQSNIVQEVECRACAWDAISIELAVPEEPDVPGDPYETEPVLAIEGAGIIHALILPVDTRRKQLFSLYDGHPDEGGRLLRRPDADKTIPFENVRFYDGLWVEPSENNSYRMSLTITYRSE